MKVLNIVCWTLIAGFLSPALAQAYDSQSYSEQFAPLSLEYQAYSQAVSQRLETRWVELDETARQDFMHRYVRLAKKRVAKVEKQSDAKFDRRAKRVVKILNLIARNQDARAAVDSEISEKPSEQELSDTRSLVATVKTLFSTEPGVTVPSVQPLAENFTIGLSKTEFVESAQRIIENFDRETHAGLSVGKTKRSMASLGDLGSLRLILVVLFFVIPIALIVIAILTMGLGWWIAAGIYVALVIYLALSGTKTESNMRILNH